MNYNISIALMLSFLILWATHPMTMMLIIITQTINISLMMGMMMGTFWFSYMLMMIMMSGMLVLFTYMASIASNEKFKSINKIILPSILILIISNKILLENKMLINNELTLMMMALFNKTSSYITIMMVMYLLFSMMTISMIVNINQGPLRSKK
uniref:NADH dehydrogenase subunit 6 n=1 Tax=Pylorgus porrectus TaxID=3051108 RepID=UPI0025AA0061|nr:NADH dehydrogenase subunit 6 [Pylorgus porrectus]WIF28483.1 NADH dehydrogenase subunit 6 [Pylorgus porrectus]